MPRAANRSRGTGETPEPVKRPHHALDELNKAIENAAAEAGSPDWLKFKTDSTGQAVVWEILWQTSATFATNN